MKAVLLLYQDNMMPDLSEAIDNAKYSVVVSETKDVLSAADEVIAIMSQQMGYSPTSHRV